MLTQAEISNYRTFEKRKSFSLQARLKSFTYAFSGFKLLFRNEHNSWIHLGATTAVVIAGILFQISLYEWIIILILVGIVFVTEIINTAIEYLSDFVSPQYSEKIKNVKDLAAAAVLTSSVIAAIAGSIIFLSKIL
jgi:diacylglycerol kinase